MKGLVLLENCCREDQPLCCWQGLFVRAECCLTQDQSVMVHLPFFKIVFPACLFSLGSPKQPDEHIEMCSLLFLLHKKLISFAFPNSCHSSQCCIGRLHLMHDQACDREPSLPYCSKYLNCLLVRNRGVQLLHYTECYSDVIFS